MTATAKCLLLNYQEKKWFKLRQQRYFFKSLVKCFCLQLLLWFGELKTFEKKSAVYPCDNVLFWTNTKKILTVISFIAWENSRNFPIGWSLLQPISTKNPDLGAVASAVCFFSAHFSQTSFRGDSVAKCWLLSQAISFKVSRCFYSFFVVFLVCVISWCDVCLSVFLQESSENPNPLAKAELNLLAHLVGGANKKTESKLIPKIQNKIRLSCPIRLLQK